tara:strand:+ start:307 stop:798 length:492 start_codon:yes stop_codon:yes gene_type:complete
MAYKMKGFSGFKNSPVKAADAGLVKAADNMSRGLENPTSIIGEGVIGFLDGFKKSYRPKPKDKSISFKNASTSGNSSDPYDPSIMSPSSDQFVNKKNKKISLNIRDLFKKKEIKNPKGSTTGTLSPEEQEIFLEQYDPMSNIEKSEAKTRRNKKNRRRNRERP